MTVSGTVSDIKGNIFAKQIFPSLVLTPLLMGFPVDCCSGGGRWVSEKTGMMPYQSII